MRTRLIYTFLGALLLTRCFAAPESARGEEIDRVLASVNGTIITQSDLRMAADLNLVLGFGKKTETGESSSEELQRLVDLELIRQELVNFPLADDDQSGINAQIAELRQGYTEIGGLDNLLARLGLRENELDSYIRLQASIKRFVALRFNPFVTVSQTEIQEYYLNQLTPRLKKAGAEIPPVTEVSAAIEQIITESKVNTALESWIKDLRSHSRIEILAVADKASTSPNAAPGTTGGEVDPRPSKIGRIQK